MSSRRPGFDGRELLDLGGLDATRELVACLPVGPLRAFDAATFDLRPQLARVTAETLVLAGRGDFICGGPAAEAIAVEIEGAELVLLDGAGHLPFVEQPEAFRSTVESFLSR